VDKRFCSSRENPEQNKKIEKFVGNFPFSHNKRLFVVYNMALKSLILRK
jgi:hypothetical protein